MILTSGHHHQVSGCPHRGALEPLIGYLIGYSDFKENLLVSKKRDGGWGLDQEYVNFRQRLIEKSCS